MNKEKQLVQLDKPFDKYYVSESGDIIYQKADGTQRIRKLTPDEGGYLTTTLSVKVDGKTYLKRVVAKNLVAQLFVPNPENYRYVEHIDGNKENIDASNLRWVRTPSKGMRRSGANAGIRVKCVETGQEFYSGYSASQKFGVSATRIYQVLDNEDRTAAGYHFITVKRV